MPFYITLVLAILVFIKFLKTAPVLTKKAARKFRTRVENFKRKIGSKIFESKCLIISLEELPIAVDKNFTGIICWRIQLFDANTGKKMKNFPPEAILGIDFYVIGSRGSVSSKFEIHEKCSYLLHDNNFDLIQSDDFIGMTQRKFS